MEKHGRETQEKPERWNKGQQVTRTQEQQRKLTQEKTER